MSTSPVRTQGPRTPQAQPDKPVPVPTVRVVELHPVNGQGSLQAFVAVTLSKRLTIRDVRVIQQVGQRPWCSMPTKSWVDAKDGKTKYRPLVDLPADWMQAVEAAVVDAWESYQRDGILPGSAVIGGRQA